MTTAVQMQSEYRDLPLSVLIESKTNPRRIFDDAALKELAASIRSQGILSPLLVRPAAARPCPVTSTSRSSHKTPTRRSTGIGRSTRPANP
jgi:ParB family chromosome partitioning protein